MSLIKASVKKNLEIYFPKTDSPRFIIGVSGGIDSMCLLHVFKELNIEGVVCHVNYQKRGTASDKDAELVEEMSEKWGFEYRLFTANPTDAGNQNFQQWARDFRYGTFNNLLQQYDDDGIAVAHHKDDQVETILQKLFRGAGLAGLGGMSVWEKPIFRPLLEVSLAQIHQYADDQDIPYRLDESNKKSDFARNFLRNEWTEKLSGFFPGWKDNVLSLQEKAQHFEQCTEWIIGQITDEQGIQRQALHSLPAGPQRSAVLQMIKQRVPGVEVSRHGLERISELSKLQTGQEVELTSNVSIVRDRDHYVLTIDRDTSLASNTIEDKELEQGSKQIGDLIFSLIDFENPNFKQALFLDADKISWPLTLRYWKPGDQLKPFGMDGHQKVSDHLTNRKINAARKEEAMVIESFEDTICAVIFPPIKNKRQPGTIADQMRCSTDTERCLKIMVTD